MVKKFFSIIFISAIGVSIHAQTHKSVSHTLHNTSSEQTIHLTNYDDSVSYALGLSIGKYYKQQGINNINTTLLSRGIKTVINKDSALFTDEQIGTILMSAQEHYATQKAASAKAEGRAFLEKNKRNPNVVSLPDGVQYQILTKGTGAIPTDTNNVKVNYVGALLNGQEFDNSYKRGEPININVTRVIPGWTEILKLMPVGSKWRIWIPSDLAYGDHGSQDVIPPGATLQFDIELLGINH